MCGALGLLPTRRTLDAVQLARARGSHAVGMLLSSSAQPGVRVETAPEWHSHGVLVFSSLYIVFELLLAFVVLVSLALCCCVNRGFQALTTRHVDSA
ncbi:hypothetical protein KFE25_003175 [Diacronema lutheri]|uniref:Uncharacterized protein n=1 Tax=Diacronema lutheri TaxID=2081491 RepID=A0A8J5X599_DIALT|nr:hypothetical protein KFE25_003175 [Diacronema lutheri]